MMKRKAKNVYCLVLDFIDVVTFYSNVREIKDRYLSTKKFYLTTFFFKITTFF